MEPGKETALLLQPARPTGKSGTVWLSHGGLQIRRDHLYQVKFLARAEKPAEFRVRVEQTDGGRGNLGLDEVVPVGKAWQPYEFTFQAPSRREGAARIVIDRFGKASPGYQLSKPSIREVGFYHPNSGLYAIWHSWKKTEHRDIYKELDFVRGGQIVRGWGEMVSAKDPTKYDFSSIRNELQEHVAAGKCAWVEVMGTSHPEWMFESVPYYHKELNRQVYDKKGSLRYWHPNYIAAHKDMLRQLGRYLNGLKPDGSGPDPDAVNDTERKAIVGIRQTFAAIGGEPWEPEVGEMPGEDDPGWIVPKKAGGLGPPWHHVDRRLEYEDEIMDAYRKYLPPIYIFARAEYFKTTWFIEANPFKYSDSEQDRIREKEEPRCKLLEDGELGFFITGEGIEPRDSAADVLSDAFMDYTRTGRTVSHTETVHGPEFHKSPSGRVFPRRVSPAQWIYWTSLIALHEGASFITARGGELARTKVDDEEGCEFRDAYRFTAKYAGYHASPTVSPGAWVAMREGLRLQGDYNFLMTRLEGDENEALPHLPGEFDPLYGTAIHCVGLESQRYGAWARKTPANGRMRFDLNDDFVESLAGTPAKVRVVYLDNSEVGKFTVACSGLLFHQKLSKSQMWKEVLFDIPHSAFYPHDKDDAEITILPDVDLTLHMVEVQRAQPAIWHTARQ